MRQSINRMQTARFKKEETQLHFRDLRAKMNSIVIEVTIGNHRLKMLEVVLIVDVADREDPGTKI